MIVMLSNLRVENEIILRIIKLSIRQPADDARSALSRCLVRRRACTANPESCSAITIPGPQQGAKLDFSGSNTISWTSVTTDPVSFEIVLVSPNNSTIAQYVITESVNTTENKYSFSNFVTAVGDNYQINFIGNVGTNRGIISQSQTFAVTKSSVASSTPSSAGSTATGTGASASATLGYLF